MAANGIFAEVSRVLGCGASEVNVTASKICQLVTKQRNSIILKVRSIAVW